MMELFLLFIILFILFDLESKVSKISTRDPMTQKFTSQEIRKLVGKTVCLNLKNEDIQDSYLFDPISNTKGIIVENDEEWLLFQYETKKEVVQQYFRIQDISSIDEV